MTVLPLQRFSIISLNEYLETILSILSLMAFLYLVGRFTLIRSSARSSVGPNERTNERISDERKLVI